MPEGTDPRIVLRTTRALAMRAFRRRYQAVPSCAEPGDRALPCATTSAPARVETPQRGPTLGIDLDGRRGGGPRAPARHRLVTLGDSLTHGFHNLSLFDPKLSYPGLIARALGCYQDFAPPFVGEFGSHPLNLERALRAGQGLLGRFPLNTIAAVHFVQRATDYWHRQAAARLDERPSPPGGRINRNLAVYGWDLRDLLSRTADVEAAYLGHALESPLPFGPLYLLRYADICKRFAGLLVLDTARDHDGRALTPLEAARALGEDGGIETLIVFIGANNVIGAVGDLRVCWSQDAGYRDLYLKARYNAWCPDHFQSELALVADAVRRVDAQRVIWLTVPHVNVPPAARPAGEKVEIGGVEYAEYYTSPWIPSGQFDPRNDPRLTAQEMHELNAAVDRYNHDIVDTVARERRSGGDWLLFDSCDFLDRLAAGTYPLPAPLPSLEPPLDTRSFETDEKGRRTQGGLFSLDNVHPTTVGYGVLAQALLHVMSDQGVSFSNPIGDPAFLPGDRPAIDFSYLLEQDTLVSDPPRAVTADKGLAEEVMDAFQVTHLLRRLM